VEFRIQKQNVCAQISWTNLRDDKRDPAVRKKMKKKKKKKRKKEKGDAGWLGLLLGRAALNTRRTRRADAGCGRLGRFYPSSVRRPETFFFFYSFSNLTENCLLFCLKI
jgi:hypothetical protein